MRVASIKCDRCGDYIDADPALLKQVGFVVGTLHDPASGKSKDDEILVDLCYECCRATLAKAVAELGESTSVGLVEWIRRRPPLRKHSK